MRRAPRMAATARCPKRDWPSTRSWVGGAPCGKRLRREAKSRYPDFRVWCATAPPPPLGYPTCPDPIHPPERLLAGGPSLTLPPLNIVPYLAYHGREGVTP